MPVSTAYAARRARSGLPYRLLAPAAPPPPAGYPLVLVLHGSGAIGSDNLAQLDALAASWALPQVMADFPAYVVAPQFMARTADYARGPDGILQARTDPPLRAALALVDELAARYPIDRRRIYVTGFSMGASSVWLALLARPDLFAAAVPISGIAPARAGRAFARRAALDPARRRRYRQPAGFRPRDARCAALRRAGNAQAELLMYAGLPHAIAPEVLYGRWWRTWLSVQAWRER